MIGMPRYETRWIDVQWTELAGAPGISWLKGCIVLLGHLSHSPRYGAESLNGIDCVSMCCVPRTCEMTLEASPENMALYDVVADDSFQGSCHVQSD